PKGVACDVGGSRRESPGGQIGRRGAASGGTSGLAAPVLVEQIPNGPGQWLANELLDSRSDDCDHHPGRAQQKPVAPGHGGRPCLSSSGCIVPSAATKKLGVVSSAAARHRYRWHASPIPMTERT